MKAKNNNNNKNSRVIRKSVPMTVMRAILVLLTLVYPLFMVILSGAGLVYNSDSYGEDIVRIGALLIASGVAMGIGTLLVMLKQNIASVIVEIPAFALCMTMLNKLVTHADSAGWSNAHTMEPISSMYITRIIPVVMPFVLAITIALIQFFSYEEREKRRMRKQEKKAKENATAPSIVQD